MDYVQASHGPAPPGTADSGPRGGPSPPPIQASLPGPTPPLTSAPFLPTGRPLYHYMIHIVQTVVVRRNAKTAGFLKLLSHIFFREIIKEAKCSYCFLSHTVSPPWQAGYQQSFWININIEGDFKLIIIKNK